VTIAFNIAPLFLKFEPDPINKKSKKARNLEKMIGEYVRIRMSNRDYINFAGQIFII